MYNRDNIFWSTGAGPWGPASGEGCAATKPETRNPKSGPRSAFTLLEVMLAVAIVGTALFTIAMAIGRCTDAAKKASNYTTAHDLAELKLLEFNNATNFTLGMTTGDFDTNFPNFQWQREVTEENTGLNALYRQTLMVKWRERNRDYDVTLYSFLYNPIAASNSSGNALGPGAMGGGS